MISKILTVITPTIGRASLDRLTESIKLQSLPGLVQHLIMWDDFRLADSKNPDYYNNEHTQSIIMRENFGKNGNAPGSPLRAVALMAADTPWVTFADDDVWWNNDHIENIISTINNHNNINWLSTLRHIWEADSKYIGVDRFESVGDEASRKTPYEMCDNNCMIFKREYGTYAAHLYRNTVNYDDDRLMYGFLKQHAGIKGYTDKATVNQICPEKLIAFFKEGCSPS